MLASAILSLLCPPAYADDNLTAQQLAASDADLLLVGPDAVGGIGDWRLSNGLIAVIINDLGRDTDGFFYGGIPVDIGLVDRPGSDQFIELFPLLNLGQDVHIPYDTIQAEVDEDEARIVVRTASGLTTREGGSWLPETEQLSGLQVETVYALRPKESFVRIRTTITNNNPDASGVMYVGHAALQARRGLRPYTGSLQRRLSGHGFQHISFNRHKPLSITAALHPYSFAAFTPGRALPDPIVYGIYSPTQLDASGALWGVSNQDATVMGTFLRRPRWRPYSLGILRLLRQTGYEMASGERFVFETHLYAAAGRDVAAITDHIFPASGVASPGTGVQGQLTDASVWTQIDIADRSGNPITHMTPARPEDGAAEPGFFQAILPAGAYTATVWMESRQPQTLDFEVSAGTMTTLAPLTPAPVGELDLTAALVDGQPTALVIIGQNGTPDPIWGADHPGVRIDGLPAKDALRSNKIVLGGDELDPASVSLPAGDYRVIATRGIEWDVHVQDVTIAPTGEAVVLAPLALERQISIDGAASGDFHVHSQASADTAMPARLQVRAYAAAGVDVLVSTEHDRVLDLDPIVAAEHMEDHILPVTGVEVTGSTKHPDSPWTIGHWNAYPVEATDAPRGGAPISEAITAEQAIAAMRAMPGEPVVQLNHGRAGLVEDEADPEAFLDHLTHRGAPGFEPHRPVTAEGNHHLLHGDATARTRPIDMEAIELLNGHEFAAYLRLREDLFALWRQGYTVTGMGNSDSHALPEPQGFPRTYLLEVLTQPEPAQDARLREEAAGAGDIAPGEDAADAAESAPSEPVLLESSVIAAVREGRVFGTTGPIFTRCDISGVGPGGLAPATDGAAVLNLTISAVPWVPVEEVRIFVDGVLTQTLPVQAEDDTIVRFAQSISLPVSADAFISVEAGASLTGDPLAPMALPGGVFNDIAPGYAPLAFSNPIRVDADGNGVWTPPGLPE